MRAAAPGAWLLVASFTALWACGPDAPVNPAWRVDVPMVPSAGTGQEYALLHVEELILAARGGFDVTELFRARFWFGWHAPSPGNTIDLEHAVWTEDELRGCSHVERGRLMLDCTFEGTTTNPDRLHLSGWIAWFPHTKDRTSGELVWALRGRVEHARLPWDDTLDEHVSVTLSPQGMKGTVELSGATGERSPSPGPWWSVLTVDVGFDPSYVADLLADRFPLGACQQPVSRGTFETRLLVEDPPERLAGRVIWSSCTEATAEWGGSP
ncbi:MAG: hypothetical protein QM704_11665 [Anaeromyxobacteraceae bacterium]